MPDRDTPPAADPGHGRNPGYAEDQPRDRRDARRLATPPPDEAARDGDAADSADPRKTP